MSTFTKIILIDFDGVINSYVSGYVEDDLPDPPVPGAIEFLETLCAQEDIQVAIYSSRSRKKTSITMMQRWLTRYGLKLSTRNKILFPQYKLPAWLTIDDRAICFTGKFPTVDEIVNFKPWNYREKG